MLFPGNSTGEREARQCGQDDGQGNDTDRDDDAGEHVAGEVSPDQASTKVAEMNRGGDPETALRVVGGGDRRQHHTDERDDRDQAEDDRTT